MVLPAEQLVSSTRHARSELAAPIVAAAAATPAAEANHTTERHPLVYFVGLNKGTTAVEVFGAALAAKTSRRSRLSKNGARRRLPFSRDTSVPEGDPTVNELL